MKEVFINVAIAFIVWVAIDLVFSDQTLAGVLISNFVTIIVLLLLYFLIKFIIKWVKKLTKSGVK